MKHEQRLTKLEARYAPAMPDFTKLSDEELRRIIADGLAVEYDSVHVEKIINFIVNATDADLELIAAGQPVPALEALLSGEPQAQPVANPQTNNQKRG